MSDVTASSYGVFPVTARASNQALASSLNLQATLAWGAAGIGTIMMFAAVSEGWRLWTGADLALPGNLSLFVQPLLGIAVVALIMFAVRRAGLVPAEYLGLHRPRLRQVFRGIGWGFLGWLGVIVIVGTIAGVMYALGKLPSAPTSYPPLRELLGGADRLPFLISLWLLLLVAAPIVEEMLFRGFLYRGLVGPLGTVSTIVLTSVVFGLLHKYGFGWDRVVAITAFGLLLGWLRYRTGTIVVPIIAHATLNFVQACFLTVGILVMP